MPRLVEDLQDGLGGAVLDVVVDGQGDALDGVLQVGLRHRRVVDEDGGAAAGLLQLRLGVPADGVAALRQLHLTLLASHPV